MKTAIVAAALAVAVLTPLAVRAIPGTYTR